MTQKNCNNKEVCLGYKYSETELVFGLVSPIGTEQNIVIDILKERLKIYNYNVKEIKVSTDVIKQIYPPDKDFNNEYDRINYYIKKGNEIRSNSVDNSVLSLGIASEIYRDRDNDENNEPIAKKRTAYIISSLKHPEEITCLREIYTDGFYVIGIDSDENRKLKYLIEEKRIEEDLANELIRVDADEQEKHGQHTRDTFQMSDFFIFLDQNHDKIKTSIHRILELIFGNPYITPTFDEYAMFMAFTSALRSADLSRQVGAVISKDNEILSYGANDCPKAGGGLYWPYFDADKNEIIDSSDGRDYKRGYDSSKVEQKKIIDNILENLDDTVDKEKVRTALKKSKIKDITEYGRVVHAEMEALLFCSRNSLSTKGAALYCTTFPCHNCAKHIIASGIMKVIYIEPYAKSKAFEFYDDAISNKQEDNRVHFKPFVGVGPRKFFDLFSIYLSSGYPIKRKNVEGKIVKWDESYSKARMQMLPYSYLDKEVLATSQFSDKIELLNKKN